MIRASFGTTKYCSYFLNDEKCLNPECLYLHSIDDNAETVTKVKLKLHYGRRRFREVRRCLWSNKRTLIMSLDSIWCLLKSLWSVSLFSNQKLNLSFLRQKNSTRRSSCSSWIRHPRRTANLPSLYSNCPSWKKPSQLLRPHVKPIHKRVVVTECKSDTNDKTAPPRTISNAPNTSKSRFGVELVDNNKGDEEEAVVVPEEIQNILTQYKSLHLLNPCSNNSAENSSTGIKWIEELLNDEPQSTIKSSPTNIKYTNGPIISCDPDILRFNASKKDFDEVFKNKWYYRTIWQTEAMRIHWRYL